MGLRQCCVWVCCGIAASLPTALAQPANAGWGLPQLMQGMAQVRSASARFTERQTVPMLNAPLMISGSLSYVAPDYVRKTTTSPLPEDFVLDHDQVTLTSGPNHQTQVFSLHQSPQIGGLVEGIRATLAGDLPSLERVYDVRLSGTEAHWQLLLRPKDPQVTHFVKWILIAGRQNQIQTIDTASGAGDHSEMGVAEDVTDAR
jgi:hypothetical protein